MKQQCYVYLFFTLTLCVGAPCGYVLPAKLKGAQKIASILQRIVSTRSKKTIFQEALFPPDDNVLPLLIGLIKAESADPYGKIDLTAYQFSSKEVAQSLLEAHKEQGTRIRIVSDVNSLGGRYDYIRELQHEGVPVNVYPAVGTPKKYTLMHNKFIVFHALSCIWTGSMNLTTSGMNTNQENVLVVRDSRLVRDYSAQFERLLTRSTQL